MRLAFLIIVFHIVKRRESRVCEDVVALRSRIIHRLVGVDGEDVGLAVLCDIVSCVLSASNFESYLPSSVPSRAPGISRRISGYPPRWLL